MNRWRQTRYSWRRNKAALAGSSHQKADAITIAMTDRAVDVSEEATEGIIIDYDAEGRGRRHRSSGCLEMLILPLYSPSASRCRAWRRELEFRVVGSEVNYDRARASASLPPP